MLDHTHVCITKDCKKKLDYISDVSGLSKVKILDILLTNLYSIASGFEFLNLDFDESISHSTLYITCSGKRRLIMKKEVETND